MAVGIRYEGGDGKEHEFVAETGDDTNLMLGAPKNAFTVWRSSHVGEDGERKFDFWVKIPRINVDGNFVSRAGVFRIDGVNYSNGAAFHDEINDFSAPPDFIPEKIRFDSRRTAIRDSFSYDFRPYPYSAVEPSIDSTVGNWLFLASSDGDDGEPKDGLKYDVCLVRERVRVYRGRHYGREDPPAGIDRYFEYAIIGEKDVVSSVLEKMDGRKGKTYTNPDYWTHPEQWIDMGDPEEVDAWSWYFQFQTSDKFQWYLRKYFDIIFVDRYDAVGFDHEVIERRTFAEIEDWELVKNDTLKKNTYYVVIKDKHGAVLDVKTTDKFGVQVKDVIDEWAERFGESVLETRVVDDLVLNLK